MTTLGETTLSQSMIQAIRGMNDILPSESPYWQMIEKACRDCAQQYGYQEIRFPIVEQTELFKRTIGQATDIVEKEMYTFTDRNGDQLTLRPEGTAGCVRAGIEHGLFHNQIQRLWYLGPMFRHERPQKGRYRQFHQFGVEAFGMVDPYVDVEQILMMHRLWQQLGIKTIELQINSLGSSASREQYRKVLVEYFSNNRNQLDADSQRRLITNPLRILDSKVPEMQELIAEAPKMIEFLDMEAAAHFAKFRHLLELAGVPYTLNPTLVRGLDYYGLTVYEWVSTELGAQNAVCSGGRYDRLIEQMGGKPTPAVGFALGLERLVLLLQSTQNIIYKPDIYLILVDEQSMEQGLLIAERLRTAIPNLKMIANFAAGGLKSQFRRADKSGCHFAMIIGAEELKTGMWTLKNMHNAEEHRLLTWDQVIQLLINGVNCER